MSTWGQAFVLNDSKIPYHFNITRDVELGDVDLDGDWDALLGNGSQDAPVQNVIWINQGGLQGSEEGFFLDETAARLPQTEDTTFDLCLGDIDGDGDLDLHVSNSSWLFFNWGNRWQVNQGGTQGGTLGYFVDETASRWIGLGEPGSSVGPAFVKFGTFLDDCRDSEFADLDNDGDLDLVHSTYWFGAPHQPARLFLNDGDGRFEEFNPPGVQTTYGTLTEGMPGVWCEGLYDNDTSDTAGAFCDPTMVCWDADVGDLDGDFDLDLVFSDDFWDPGFFANRLDGSALAPAAGGLAFRDVWGAVLAPGYGSNEDNCQELGDLDGDGDLDLVGGDYVGLPSTYDGAFECVDGVFVLRQTMPNTGQKYSVRLFDYDQDGDLDILSAGTTVDLYANDGGFSFSQVPIPSWVPAATWDAEVADLDGDGDLDILAVTQGSSGKHLLVNQGTPDVHAPYLPAVEDVGDRTAASTPIAVRAQVYDNAPHAVTAHNATRVEVAVDGVALPPLAAQSSRGQIFRAELPGNLVGAVRYRFVSKDARGNAGASAEISYTASSVAGFQSPYGTATAGLVGGEPLLRALGVPFAFSTLYLGLSSGAPAGTPAVIVIGSQPLATGLHIPGLLFLQVGGVSVAVKPGLLDSGGDLVLSAPLGALPPGLSGYAQGFVLDPTAAGEVFASSRGLAITTQ